MVAEATSAATATVATLSRVGATQLQTAYSNLSQGARGLQLQHVEYQILLDRFNDAQAQVEKAEKRIGVELLTEDPEVRNHMINLQRMMENPIPDVEPAGTWRLWFTEVFLDAETLRRRRQIDGEAISRQTQRVDQWIQRFQDLLQASVAHLQKHGEPFAEPGPTVSAAKRAEHSRKTAEMAMQAKLLAKKLEPLELGHWVDFLCKHGFTADNLRDQALHAGILRAYDNDVEGRAGLEANELRILYHEFIGVPTEVEDVLVKLLMQRHVSQSLVRSIEKRELTLSDLLHLTEAEAHEIAGVEAQFLVLTRFLDEQRLFRAATNLADGKRKLAVYAELAKGALKQLITSPPEIVVTLMKKVRPVHGCSFTTLAQILTCNELRARSLQPHNQRSVYDVLWQDYRKVFEKYTRNCRSTETAASSSSSSARAEFCPICFKVVLSYAEVVIKESWGSTRMGIRRKAKLEGALRQHTTLDEDALQRLHCESSTLASRMRAESGVAWWMDVPLCTNKRIFAINGPNADYGPVSLVFRKSVLQHPHCEVLVNSAVTMVTGDSYELREWATPSHYAVEGGLDIRAMHRGISGRRADILMQDEVRLWRKAVDEQRLKLSDDNEDDFYQHLAREVTAQATLALAPKEEEDRPTGLMALIQSAFGYIQGEVEDSEPDNKKKRLPWYIAAAQPAPSAS